MSALGKELGKYTAIARVQLSDRLAYAGDLATQSLSIVLFMWIFMQLWRATYSSSDQQLIAGLSLGDTLWYLMAAEVMMLSKPRLFRAISEAVKDGSIAYLLNKPYNFLLYQLSVGLGDLLPRLAFNLMAGGAITWWLVGSPSALWSLPMLLVLYLFAWLIDFSISALIGLAAFAMEEVSPLDWIYSKALLVAGGVLIPLDFFPDWLQKICKSLPFAYTIYGPARFWISPSWDGFVHLLIRQLFWAAIGICLLVWTYRRGVARLNINGG